MADPIPCSDCGRDLAPHCGSRSCPWLICTNHACTAAVYDTDHERLRRRDGTIENYGGQA